MTRLAIKLGTRIIAFLLITPFLLNNMAIVMESIAELDDVLASIFEILLDTKRGYEESRFITLTDSIKASISIILSIFYLISLLLAALSLSPLLYALAVLIQFVINPPTTSTQLNTYNIALEYLGYVAPVFVLGFLSVIDNTWRPGLTYSLRIQKFSLFTISFLLVLGSVGVASILISYAIWRSISVIEEGWMVVDESSLRSLIVALVKHPIGKALLLGFILIFFYLVSYNVAETILLYIKPSRRLSLDILTKIELDAPIKPPLSSIRTLGVTLLLLPLFYHLADKVLIERLINIIEDPILQTLLSIGFAWLIFYMLWLLVSRVAFATETKEPSMLAIIAGVLLMMFVYLSAYVLGYWSPDKGLIDFSIIDNILRGIIEGYTSILKILEAILMLMGAVP